MWFLDVTWTMGIIALLVFLWIYKTYFYTKGKKIPTYFHLNVPHLGTIAPLAFDWLCKQHGDVFRVFIGPIELYVVRDPELYKELYSKRKETDFSPYVISCYNSVLPKSVLGIANHEQRKEHHRILAPLFHDVHLKQIHQAITANIDHTIKEWKQELEGKEYIDLDVRQEMLELTVDVITSTAMGFYIREMAKDKKELKEIMQAISIFMDTVNYRVMSLIPLWKLRRDSEELKWATKVLHKLVDKAILKERSQTDPIKNNLLGILLEQNEKHKDVFSDEAIRDELILFLFAGHETTTSASSCAVLALSQYPRVAKLIREEVDKELQKRTPDFGDLSQLEYSYKFLKEVLRYYPNAGASGRYTYEEIKLGDYIIPKGRNIITAYHSTHHDPTHWEKPEEFMPERWTEEFEHKKHPFQYLPFGAGERTCLGKQMATIEIRTIIAMLSQHFTFELLKPVELQTRITTGPKELWMRIRNRID